MNGLWLDTPDGEIVWAVIHIPNQYGNGAITHITTDPDDADIRVHGLIVALPVVADYRTDPPTARED